ncbi:MAG: hypothetical protein HQL25_09105 [Candidatus Omnitrophica bacterium]|nr:hypothetical protein [Candidatus Omnitrophota bacterium]
MKKGFLVFAFCLMASAVFANTIKLKSGKVVEGTIVEQEGDFVRVDNGSGVKITYYVDEIDTIDGKMILSKKNEQPTQATAIADEKDKVAFEKIIDSFIANNTLGGSKDWENLIKKDVQGFGDFAQKFPSSHFANDAQFLSFYLSVDFVAGSKEKRMEMLKKVKEFVLSHSDWQLSDWTREKFRAIHYLSAAFLMPNNCLGVFIEAQESLQNQDFLKACEKFSFLKDNLDFSKDIDGVLVYEVYGSLSHFYRKLNKSDEADSILKEGLKRFPQNERLVNVADNIIKQNKLPKDYFTKP